MNILSRRLRVGALMLPLALAACDPGQGPVEPTIRPRFNVGRTTLTVDKTAEGYRREGTTYDWTLEKTVTPSSADLAPGASATFNYTLTATRTQATTSGGVGVSGQICVTNNGITATSELRIDDIVQQFENGNWVTISSTNTVVDVSAKPVLEPGERFCYPYDIAFAGQSGVQYRNWVDATITNWDGVNLGERRGVTDIVPFTIPTTTSATQTDETASLGDVLTCPAGFTCTTSPSGLTLTGTQTINYTVTVKNVSAPCAHLDILENTATLTETDSGTPHTADESVTITTPSCEPPTGFQGCTPGYWKQKQHFGSWTLPYVPTGVSASKYNTVFGVSLFSANTTLLQALGMGGGGASRLGRHSTAALLNSANSDVNYGMTPAQVIAAVQAAVASGDYDSASEVFEELNERQCPLGRRE
ncbi:MAG: hypothetical protein WEE89_19670 [Gemmatimonadota bacterium]